MMMKTSLERLQFEAEATGFRPEILEKVFYLMDFLSAFFTNSHLKDKIVLKGGTALNLFYFNYPRLSVDIDINYIGSSEKDIMLKAREPIEKAIREIILDKGFISERQPRLNEHAGGKWRLRYSSALGNMANLEIDLNYLSRVPLWTINKLDSFPLGSYKADQISVLDKHELAGGKFAALFSRHASRDLFDAHQILSDDTFDTEKLRIAFVVYGSMSRRDWRNVSVDDIDFETRELQNMLIPLFRPDYFNQMDGKQLAKNILAECKELLSKLLPLRSHEKEFLNLLLEKGKIKPDLLCDDESLKQNIALQPGLHWKVVNIMKL